MKHRMLRIAFVAAGLTLTAALCAQDTRPSLADAAQAAEWQQAANPGLRRPTESD